MIAGSLSFSSLVIECRGSLFPFRKRSLPFLTVNATIGNQAFSHDGCKHLLVDTHMVYKALRGIKSNKSGGPDPIPGKVWKEFAFELSPVITNIYNASMVQGYVPVFLKQSEVIPVPKCSPPKVVEQDLRPISLTPHVAKVMEGLTLDSLFKQVCDKLDTHQFALAGKSTTHALVFFLQVILEALDQGDTYARIFFTDFSKGFDLVDHNILIQEMELLGVHEATIRWIGSFLTDRSRRVRIGQVYSHPVTPNGGIPQGTKNSRHCCSPY